MKANELQVGSFVLLDGKPIKVSSVHKRKIGYHTSQTKMTFVFEGKIQPIQITPELLEKNGFEREKLITLYNHYTGIDNRVSLHDDFMSMNSKNMWSVHIDSEDYCSIAHCELTYVHELQHLLRICKIDFEWKI